MKRELGKAIGIFVAVAGLIGVIVQLLTTSGKVRTISFLALFGTLILLGVWILVFSMWRRRRAGRALPPREQLDELSIGYRTVQASSKEIDWIADLERQVYTHEDAVPKHILKEWYKSNPTGFSVIRMTNSQKIGHIDILPIRPTTLNTFVEGNIVERDIRGDSLYAPGDRESIRDIYVESIIVLPPKGFSKVPAMLSVLKSFNGLVERICDPTRLDNVYAIAASTSGERLLRRLGFDLLVPSKNRADEHDLFVVKFIDLAARIKTILAARHSELKA